MLVTWLDQLQPIKSYLWKVDIPIDWVTAGNQPPIQFLCQLFSYQDIFDHGDFGHLDDGVLSAATRPVFTGLSVLVAGQSAANDATSHD